MAPGEVVVIQSAHNGSQDICQFAISPNIYRENRSRQRQSRVENHLLQLGLDPNCGFRSFAAGVPTS